MEKRASLVRASPAGIGQVANAVATSAVSKLVAATRPTATSFIRHLVLNTNTDAYAAACLALASAPKIHGKDVQCPVFIIGGEEDYLAAPQAVKAWSEEIPSGKGGHLVLKDVGHWGAIESPVQVAQALRQALGPE